MRDLLKGLVVAVLAAVLMALQKMLENHGLRLTSEDLAVIPDIAATAALGYLIKQLFTDEDGKLGGVI